MASPARYLGKTSSDWSRLLQDGEPVVRRLAADALGELGAAAKDEAPQLRSLLKDEVEFVAVWAAAALAHVDPSCQDAIEKLLEATQSSTYFVRSLAAWHLGRLGRDHPAAAAALPAIAKLLDDEDPSVGVEAALACDRLSGKKHRTWTPL